MAIVTTQITVPEAILPLIEDAATEQGQTIDVFLGAELANGQSPRSIANDRLQQAFYRLQARDVHPSEVLAESRAHALANAPKPEQVAA